MAQLSWVLTKMKNTVALKPCLCQQNRGLIKIKYHETCLLSVTSPESLIHQAVSLSLRQSCAFNPQSNTNQNTVCMTTGL